MDSRLLVVFALLCLQAVLVQSGPGTSPSSAVLPPMGNSVALVTVTRNASTTFICSKGDSQSTEWVVRSTLATLVSPSNSSLVLGGFRHVAGHKTSAGFRWSMFITNPEDRSESGHEYTTLTGKLLSVSTEDYQLYEISTHSEPIIDRYSFILARFESSGAVSEAKGPVCTVGQVAMVPFQATFTFYTLDSLPPPVENLHLSVPKGHRFLQSFFATGQAHWVEIAHDSGDTTWMLSYATAALAEVPGGPQVGRLDVVHDGPISGAPGPLRSSWTIFAPNSRGVESSFSALEIASASVNSRDWPWQLYSRVEGLQEVSYVQFLSTKGGGDPTTAGNVMPLEDLKETLDFSGVCWFYAPLN